MNSDDNFCLPPLQVTPEPLDKDFLVEPYFDIDLMHLRPAYGASVRAYIESGMLPGRYAGGRLHTNRQQLEMWLNDIGHSSYDPNDPAFVMPMDPIAPWMQKTTAHWHPETIYIS